MPQAILLSLLILLPQLSAQAATLEQCRALREQRDALAARAMAAEIQLVRAYRNRLCPQLNQQAEETNANHSVSASKPAAPPPALDYQALLRCRNQAERQLERDHRRLYRNRLGFTFYTAAGADLARQADRLSSDRNTAGCQP